MNLRLRNGKRVLEKGRGHASVRHACNILTFIRTLQDIKLAPACTDFRCAITIMSRPLRNIRTIKNTDVICFWLSLCAPLLFFRLSWPGVSGALSLSFNAE